MRLRFTKLTRCVGEELINVYSFSDDNSSSSSYSYPLIVLDSFDVKELFKELAQELEIQTLILELAGEIMDEKENDIKKEFNT